MAPLSAFKHGVKSVLNIPHDGYKRRSRRQVISFNEALENLKASHTGFVTCGAFHSFGRCRKQVALIDSNTPANLDQFDITDIQTPIKLMPMMLCSTHWGKTVYYNALFLDWLSVHGSKQDHPHFENTVVDYQSAIAIDYKEKTLSNVDLPSKSTLEDRGRPVSAPDSRTKDDSYQNDLNKADKLQTEIDYGQPSPSNPESHRAAQNLPENYVLVGMESYASIELGVVNLEIMYQQNLKCIAMTSNGWRCPIIIHKEELLKARELLSHSATSGSELDIEALPRLVLCPGHGLGSLPQIYSEKWAAFSEQRLPKEEAMSKFNADFWMSVQFFSNDGREDVANQTKRPIRPRSTSNKSARQGDVYEFGSTESVGDNSLRPPAKIPLDSQRQMFEFSSVSAPVFTGVRPIEKNIQLDINASSVFEKDIEKAIPLELEKGTQDSGPKAFPNLPLSQGTAQQSKQTYSQATIDRSLRNEMLTSNPGGYVHIFKSPDGKLLRIGKTRDIHRCKQQSQSGCQLQDFDEVEVRRVYTMYPERLTKLVHLELQNFRATLSCQCHCHAGDGIEATTLKHGEWFNVSESVGEFSILNWKDFVCRAYKSDGTIKEEWNTKLDSLPKPSVYETDLLEKVLGDNATDTETDDYHQYR